VFHKNPLQAQHLLCAVPPGNGTMDDAHAMLRALKVEVGDFGRASPLRLGEGGQTRDFAYVAMML
jgi:hypothetical protein